MAGTYTVTATAGGKSDTADSSWNQANVDYARTVSATTKGDGIDVATVKDRFGNPVKGVELTATRVGTVVTPVVADVLGVVNRIVETPRFAAEVYETVNAVETVELDVNVMLSTSEVVDVEASV